MFKQFFIFLVIIISYIQLNQTILAVEPTYPGTNSLSTINDYGAGSLVKGINDLQREVSRSASLQQNRLAQIIKRADLMISMRITSLNNLSSKIQNDDRLSLDAKTSLNTDIQTSISGLNSLKSKIDSDTDSSIAEADTKQIVSQYKIYSFLEPKIQLIITMGNMKKTVTAISSVVPQIQNLINSLQSQGKDVSSLNSLVADINSQLQTINNTLQTDNITVTNLSLSSSNPNTTITQVRSDLKNIVYMDFYKIRSDIGQMRVIFKALIVGHSDLPKSSTDSSTQTNNQNK